MDTIPNPRPKDKYSGKCIIGTVLKFCVNLQTDVRCIWFGGFVIWA